MRPPLRFQSFRRGQSKTEVQRRNITGVQRIYIKYSVWLQTSDPRLVEQEIGNKKPAQVRDRVLQLRPFHTLYQLASANLLPEVYVHRLDVGVVMERILSQLATDCESEVVR